MLGCTSTPEAKPSAGSAKAGDNEELVLKTVRIPVERKASVRFEDGTLDEYTLSEYEQRGLITKKTRYSASAVIIERTEYRNEEGLLLEKTLMDDKGEVKSSTKYGYDNGLLISENLLNAEGKVITSFKYEYDTGGNRILQQVLSSEGALMAATRYIWKDGLLVKTELSDGAGKIIAYSVFTYTPEKLVEKQEYYSADGTLLRTEHSQYAGGRLSSLTRHNFKGDIQFEHSFEYGELGELTKKVVDDRLAGSRYSLNYEYTVREEQRMVQK